MFFSIDPHNGVAIYEQIVRQVKFAIAEETLRQGQLIPSVRVLSQQLAVNPNTLNRAFQQLQSEGLLESLRGKGLAVRPGVKERCVVARRDLISQRIRSVVNEAMLAGLQAEEISGLVTDHLNSFSSQAGQAPAASSSTSPGSHTEG